MNTKILLAATCALNIGFYTANNLADTVNARFPEFPKDKEHVFTRMFKNLPPFAPQTDLYRTGVQQLGAKDGIIDAKDNLTDPIQSIINPTVFSPNNPDNPNMTAGLPFLVSF
jgi:hypothetical protein